MTLEQRVEALEKKMAAQGYGKFAENDGDIYINDALIKSGEINAAHVRAAIDNAKDNNRAATYSNPISLKAYRHTL